MIEREHIVGKASEGELFQLLVENVKDYAIFSLDSLGRVQTWNRGATRLLGYSESEIIGQSASVFFTPEDLERRAPQRELGKAIEIGRSEEDRWHSWTR